MVEGNFGPQPVKEVPFKPNWIELDGGRLMLLLPFGNWRVAGHYLWHFKSRFGSIN